jgi:hypothetical protein
MTQSLQRGDEMRAGSLGIVLLVGLLAGCQKSDEAYGTGPRAQGRYAGIGTFDAGRMWTQIAGTAESKDAGAARIEDDEHIIVVVDTRTGEVRQCGDHSGVCVAMNPWNGQGAGLAAPVHLKKHATELDAEDRANQAAAEDTPAK